MLLHSLIVPLQPASNEYQQGMFLLRNEKEYQYLLYYNILCYIFVKNVPYLML